MKKLRQKADRNEEHMAAVWSIHNLKKTYYYLKRNGLLPTIGAALERTLAPYYAAYQYVPPSDRALELQRKTTWEKPVTISVVVPAYETREDFLTALIESLLGQTYPYWQLVLADASQSERVQKTAEKYSDPRICFFKLEENAGISENTNRGLEAATGDYIGLLDHDDYLTPDALYEMAKAIEEGRKQGQEYALLYSDEDKCDEKGTVFYEPHFKTDFNLDLFLTNNYICHFCVMKKELIRELKFRKEYDGAQDYDLVLRAVARLWEQDPCVEAGICHVPKVLYHWRCHNDSTAANPRSKQYAYDAGKRAVQDFIRGRNWKASVEEMSHVGFYKIVYEGGVFAQRPDVIALMGKGRKGLRTMSGIYDKQGRLLYEGLPLWYSGYMHRAVLAQNAAQMDVGRWVLRPQAEAVIETFWKENASKKRGTKPERQKEVCQYLISQGYRLYWDPSTKSRRRGKNGKKYRDHSEL